MQIGGEYGKNLAFNPSAWYDPDHPTIRAMDENGFLPKLTDTEVQHLLEGEPLPNPALELHVFHTLEEFQEKQNNFSTFFTSHAGSLDWLIKRRIKAFQRYELLYPDRVTELGQVENVLTSWSTAYWQSLHDAYHTMRNLTSRDDPEISMYGYIDEWFLVR